MLRLANLEDGVQYQGDDRKVRGITLPVNRLVLGEHPLNPTICYATIRPGLYGYTLFSALPSYW